MNLIKQGRAGILPVPCGTDGLATCVGLACSTDDPTKWFIAHIDCGPGVPRPPNPCYDAVRTYVADRARTLCPPPRARMYIVGNRDFSARAMIAGLQDVYGNIPPVEYLGFYIDATGQFRNLNQGGIEVDGENAFSVPAAVC